MNRAIKARLKGAAAVVTSGASLIAGPAFAQCLPTTNPGPSTTVTCSGASSDAVQATFGAANVTVNVLVGASIVRSGNVIEIYGDSVINNNGALVNNAAGSAVTIRGERAQIVNTGLIENTGPLDAFFLSRGLNFIQDADFAMVTNTASGVIRGEAGLLGAGIIGDFDLTVMNSGLIEGRGSDGLGVSASQGSTVINSGTIRASAVAEQPFVGTLVAVDLTESNIGGNARVENLAGGVIEVENLGIFSFNQFAIRTGDGDDTVINAGTIRGGVDLGLGDDLFEIRPGSILDGEFFSGGDGDDTARFAATADIALDLDFTFFDFDVIEKTGAGALNIDGDGAFNDFFLREGSVVLAPASSVFFNNLTVESGGTLLAGGELITSLLTISSGGVLQPGASVGTLNVFGDLDFAAGSIFDVEVEPGDADLIEVDGNVTIAPGARLRTTTLGAPSAFGAFGSSTTYTVINATGTVAGNFTVDPLAFFTASSVNTGSQIDLTLTRNALTFITVADTPNRVSTATEFSDLCVAAAGTLLEACDTLQLLSADGVRSGLDAISGAGLAHWRTLALESALISGDAVDSRFRRYYGGPDDLEAGRADGFQTFGQVFGSDSDVDAAVSAPGVDARHRGFILGGEAAIAGRFAAGVHFGRTTSEGDTTGPGAASIDVETFMIGGHLVGRAGDLRGQLRLSYANVDGEIERDLGSVVNGALALSEPDADLFAASASAAQRFSVGGFRLTPEASLQYIAADFDSFSETGAGTLGLDVSDVDGDYAHGQLAATFARPIDAESVTLTPHLTAGYRRVLTGASADLAAAFQGGGDAFLVSASDAGPDALILGGGVSGGFGAVSLFVNYEGLIQNDGERHGLRAGVRVAW